MPHSNRNLMPVSPVRSRHRPSWLSGLLLLLWIAAPPAHAQISDAKVDALVEALRLSAPDAGTDSGLYSDWKIKPDNIGRWSRRCLDQDVTPDRFATDEALARQVVACVMGKVLRDEFAASNQNEIVAVQRAAAWWMSGDPTQYRSGATGAYTLKVLEAYLRFF